METSNNGCVLWLASLTALTQSLYPQSLQMICQPFSTKKDYMRKTFLGLLCILY